MIFPIPDYNFMELIKTANLIMFLRLFFLSVCHFIYSVSVYNVCIYVFMSDTTVYFVNHYSAHWYFSITVKISAPKMLKLPSSTCHNGTGACTGCSASPGSSATSRSGMRRSWSSRSSWSGSQYQSRWVARLSRLTFLSIRVSDPHFFCGSGSWGYPGGGGGDG